MHDSKRSGSTIALNSLSLHPPQFASGSTTSPDDARLTLGIDPALGVTGYGLVAQTANRLRVVDAGVIRCRRSRSLESRLSELSDGIGEVLAEHRPDSFAIEELYSHYSRPTTAILMGHARGVILLAAAKAGLTVFSYAATQIKKTLTGNGRAPKSQMQFAVQHQLGLQHLPEPADVADALAIALTHCHFIRSPLKTLDQNLQSSARRRSLTAPFGQSEPGEGGSK